MSLVLAHPDHAIETVIQFIRQTFKQQHKTKAVIAVSGGIDSALALSLLVKALGPEQVTALFLPFGDQSLADSKTICEFLGVPAANQLTQEITKPVEVLAGQLDLPTSETIRKGNLMARVRMVILFDLAKSLDALVCGTENKSEHYLGYFTRFGDSASDLEPISTLYKTQVRQLAEYLQLPQVFLDKAPSAGLWQNQTDEQEMGFTYQQADQVLEQLIDHAIPENEINIPDISVQLRQKITAQVKSMSFKRQVPYQLTSITS